MIISETFYQPWRRYSSVILRLVSQAHTEETNKWKGKQNTSLCLNPMFINITITFKSISLLIRQCFMTTQTALCNIHLLSYRTLKPIDQYAGRSDFNHGLYQHIKYHAETTKAWMHMESRVCNGEIQRTYKPRKWKRRNLNNETQCHACTERRLCW